MRKKSSFPFLLFPYVNLNTIREYFNYLTHMMHTDEKLHQGGTPKTIKRTSELNKKFYRSLKKN